MANRWQYKVVEVRAGLLGLKAARVEEKLAQFGHQGWELVSVVQHGLAVWLYLKQEK